MVRGKREGGGGGISSALQATSAIVRCTGGRKATLWNRNVITVITGISPSHDPQLADVSTAAGRQARLLVITERRE